MHALINDGEPFRHLEHEDVGLSRRDLREAVSCGALVRVFDRVYRDALAPDSRRARVAAAKLAVPAHAVVSDETAAWLWGVDAHRPSDRHRATPRWVVPHGSSRSRLEGIDCRQALLSADDVVEMEGLAVTRPVRTAADLLRKQYRPHALASADGLARVGAIHASDVRAYLADLKGYRGIRQARVLAQYIDHQSASAGESWLRLRVIDAGFPRPESQLEIVDAAGVRRFLDLGYRRLKVGIEYDGRQFHTADPDVVHDGDRRQQIEAIGFVLVVARYDDVFGTDARLEHELGEILGVRPIPRWWT
jgi:hypothetical protein